MAGVLGQIKALPRPFPEGYTSPKTGEFIPPWEASKKFWFELMGYTMHANEVVDFHRSEATTLILEAPARGSKSYSTAHDIIPYCLPTKPLLDSRHAIVGTDYATNKEFEYVYDRLVKERERLCQQGAGYSIERHNYNPRSGDMEIVLNHGKDEKGHFRRAIIKGLSSQNEVSLQGEQWTTVTLSEAAEHPPHILTKHFATRTWRTYLPTTPKAKAKWLKELGEAGRKDPSLGVDVFHFPKESNPLYDHENYLKEERLATIRAQAQIGPHATARDDAFFAEQFMGLWVYYAGRVLPFDRNRHVIPFNEIDLDGATFWLSTDYGYEDPWSCGLWAVLKNGLYVRFDEIYERKLNTAGFVEKVTAMLDRYSIKRSQVTCTGDPSRPEVARILQDEGLSVVQIDKNAQRDRGAGKRRVVDLLTEGHIPNDRGGFYPGIYVTDNCRCTIDEWETLHYKDNYTNEDSHTAFSGADHAFDDTRYFVMSRPMPQRGVKETDWLREYKSLIQQPDTSFGGLMGSAAYA